jgi:hypothetical protein
MMWREVSYGKNLPSMSPPPPNFPLYTCNVNKNSFRQYHHHPSALVYMCFWDTASPAFETLATPNPKVQAFPRSGTCQGQRSIHLGLPISVSETRGFRSVCGLHMMDQRQKFMPKIELFRAASWTYWIYPWADEISWCSCSNYPLDQTSKSSSLDSSVTT